MKYFGFVSLIFFFPAALLAQSATELKGIIYNHELSGGVSVHTSGWGIFMDVAKRQELKKKTIYEFEFTQIHHPKEVKQTIDFGFSVMNLLISTSLLFL